MNKKDRTSLFRNLTLMLLCLLSVLITGRMVIKRYGKKEYAYHFSDDSIKSDTVKTYHDRLIAASKMLQDLKTELNNIKNKSHEDSILNAQYFLPEKKDTPIVLNKNEQSKILKTTPKPKAVATPSKVGIKNAVNNDTGNVKVVQPLVSTVPFVKAILFKSNGVFSQDGKAVITDKAIKTKAIQILLNIATAESPQDVDIYFRLLSPEGSLVNSEEGIKMNFDHQLMSCSFVKHVNTKQTEFRLYYIGKTPFIPGTYLLAAYYTGGKLGEVKIKLE